jgi:hypothetical protein
MMTCSNGWPTGWRKRQTKAARIRHGVVRESVNANPAVSAARADVTPLTAPDDNSC